MKATTISLIEFLAQPETVFTIPVYQRAYSWRERQCQELWTDIERAARKQRSHFLGTILFTKERADAGAPQRLSIIDGQQRLTTLMLLLVAFTEYLEARNLSVPAEFTEASSVLDGARLRQKLVLAPQTSADEPRACKLTLSPADNVTLEALVREASPDDNHSRTIVENSTLFHSLLEQDDFDLTLFWQGLQSLEIIAVEVENAQSVQSFFESLNSKGLPLNVADLARNYLLLNENHEEQTRLYKEYWAAMEEIFHPDPGSLRLDSAIRAWLSIRLRGARILSVEQTYSSFKRYVEDRFHGEKESILYELRGFSVMWAENFRYHGVKKFKSSYDWAVNGAPILTAGRPLVPPEDPEYAARLRKRLDSVPRYW